METPETPETGKKSGFTITHAIIIGLLIFICVVCGPYFVGGSSSSRTSSNNVSTQPLTATPRTVATLRATPRPSPTPKPLILSGRGDSVVDFTKWRGPAIARIRHSGSSNFSVINYNTSGTYLNLLVNTIGSYVGVLPLDFRAGEQTTRFEISADGPWEIEIVPITEITKVVAPGRFNGRGDYLFFVSGSSPVDLLEINASQATRNFVVTAYGSSPSLLVNEIAPYAGTVLVPSRSQLDDGSVILVVEATGDWTINAKTR